jgi:membrane fusion protein, adhesin transport system
MSRPPAIAYANDASAAVDDRSSGYGFTLLFVIASLLVATFAWASYAVLDEVTTGIGRVIPSQQMQVVQSLEGGIVRDLAVREGDQVDKDQVLMRIDDTSFASKLGEIRERQFALKAEITRLEAEATGKSELSFDGALIAAAPSSVRAERETFSARTQKLASETSLLRQQIVQREQERDEVSARQRKIEAELKPLRSELALNQQLANAGNVAKVDVLRLQRQVAELDGDSKILASTLPRAVAAIAEANRRIEGAAQAFRTQASERLSSVKSDLAVVEETIKGAQDRVTRAVVRSPVRGTINKLAITTLGAVVQPGQPLAEIVPVDDALRIEARVRPKDIAFIRPGQNASIKVSAYDYVIYGALQGQVDRISPDTIKDERGEPYYQVIVRTDRTHLGTAENKLQIIPGLQVTVDIQTGARTVMNYLLKPVLRAQKEAMRER